MQQQSMQQQYAAAPTAEHTNHAIIYVAVVAVNAIQPDDDTLKLSHTRNQAPTHICARVFAFEHVVMLSHTHCGVISLLQTQTGAHQQ